MAAAIVRDTTICLVAQKHHLVFPGFRAEGPAVAADVNGETRAMGKPEVMPPGWQIAPDKRFC